MEVMATKVPNTPNAAGSKMRVKRGEKTIIITCESAVPEATTRTLLINGLLRILIKIDLIGDKVSKEFSNF